MTAAPARAPDRPDVGVAELTIPDIGSLGKGGSAGARPFVALAGRGGDCRSLPAAEGTVEVPLRGGCETGGSPRPGERSTRPSAPDDGTSGRSAPLPLPPGGMVREFTALTPRRLPLIAVAGSTCPPQFRYRLDAYSLFTFPPLKSACRRIPTQYSSRVMGEYGKRGTPCRRLRPRSVGTPVTHWSRRTRTNSRGPG
jgi:hypothetical protein